MKKISLSIAAVSILLVACGVDTTGLSPASSRKPLGSESAFVLVQEFADLECPACAQANTLITKPLLQSYGDRIRFQFMHFPLSQHGNAMEAALALECAADQGKFWQLLDLAYERQATLGSTALRQWAEELELDTVLFDRCIRSNIKNAAVLADFGEGERIGVNQTPTYFVNGVKVNDASYAGVTTAVDTALQQIEQIPL
ncbi:MAG: thioredoxin domain-containing protein [Candidatus Peribacteraceae bacterium]|nr:thioredoxin domain-containing protein [Candidatus Peribacteraceae bacterium]